MRGGLLFLLLLAALTGCGKSESVARNELAQMNIVYSDASFIEQASQGNAGAVSLFMDAGINPEARNNEGQTALMAATLSNHVETVKVLLEKGANVNAANKFGGTALMIASWKGMMSL